MSENHVPTRSLGAAASPENGNGRPTKPRGSLDRTSMVKVGKGAAIAGFGGLTGSQIIVAAVRLGYLPDAYMLPEVLPVVSAVAFVVLSVVGNIVWKLISKYE